MHALWNDLKYAVRQLRRSPGFAFTVVLTLALGVGANAVVFSVLNALILRPLPVPQADRLVFFNRTGNTGGAVSSSPTQSYPDYRDFRDRNRSFSNLAIYRIQRAGVGTAGAVHASWFYEASENYFDTVGVQPALGRFFRPSDAHGPNSIPFIVLSYSYWQRAFAGDPQVLGRVVEVNKHPFTVLGVVPSGFTGTELFLAPDFWAPLVDMEELDGYDVRERRGSHSLWVMGRLRPGATVTQAEADLNGVSKHLAAENMEDEGLGIRLSRPGLIGDLIGRPVHAFLYGVTALAALVLLAACANLGSLFSARASDRSRELALRLALGASRAAVLRQLATESIAVSLVGGCLGLLLAGALTQVLSAWRPSPDFPVAVSVDADARVAAVALVLSILSGLFFALLPARQVWRADAWAVIKNGPVTATGSRRWTLRDALLVVQIVLCSVLVTSSLVAVRGLARSLHTSFGFQAEGALLASFDLRMSGYSDETAGAAQHRALDAVAALPGVTAAGFINTTPLSPSASDATVFRDGVTDFRDSNAAADASYYSASPGYFAAAHTRLLVGRDFTWHDDAAAPRVAIVNQVFARKVFGTANAVGLHFRRSGQRYEVIGVVEDGKYQTLTEDPMAAMFFAADQVTNTQTVMVVRSRDGEAATAAAMQAALTRVDPHLPFTLGTWNQALGIALFPSVAATVSLGVMGGLAAMLAVTGIFGMASYAVSKRLRELALRVALGAGRKEVLQAALGRPARLLAYGSVVGLGLGALSSRLLAHVVYQASSQDPVVLLGVIAAMVLLALAATWLPARRALQVDPATLLREE